MAREHPANNFDAVRLLAACMVLCSHQFALTARPEPRLFGLMTLGTFGVLIFFVVSGYLVAQSWERDPHVLRFSVKRLLRIWPGLAVVTCVSVWVVGPLMTSWSLHDYIRSPVTWNYLSQLYLAHPLHLPGVFERSDYPVVNGSLWTIPIEVGWYGVLLVAGMCGVLRQRMRWLLLALVACYATCIYLVYDVQHNPRASFLGPDFGCEYGTFFCQGVLLFQLRRFWMRHGLLLLGGLALLAILLAVVNHGYAALFVILPLVVIRLGTWSTPVVRRCGRLGDFSYGIYIYAFLIQQTLVQVMGTNQPYWWGLLVSMACTLVCAVLSWHLVERPALSLKLRMPGAMRPAGDGAHLPREDRHLPQVNAPARTPP